MVASSVVVCSVRSCTTVLDGTRLRQLRREHGLSQEQLASRARISLTTVARLDGSPRPHAAAGHWPGLPRRWMSNPAQSVRPPPPAELSHCRRHEPVLLPGDGQLCSYQSLTSGLSEFNVGTCRHR